MKYKTHFYCIVAGILLGLLVSFCLKRCNRQPVETIKVERDTVYRYDTIPHYYPKPVEVTKTKTEYRWLTRVVTENVGGEKNSANSASFPRDSVLVEVPIESKHYHADEYDAWVSGYEPNLDSIRIYHKTEIITNMVTKYAQPNKFSLDLRAGADYLHDARKLHPYVMGDFGYNISNRWQVGVSGGLYNADNIQPYYGGYIKMHVF